MTSSASAPAARTAARLGRIASRSTMSAISTASRAARSSSVPAAGERRVVEVRQHRFGLERDVVAHAGAAEHAPERLAIAPHGRHALAQRLHEQPAQLARGRRRRRIGERAQPTDRARAGGGDAPAPRESSQRRRNRREREQRPVPRTRRDGIAPLVAQDDADRQVRSRRRVGATRASRRATTTEIGDVSMTAYRPSTGSKYG